jgi:cytochrome c-type biogenesis protein CcmH/NrfG
MILNETKRKQLFTILSITFFVGSTAVGMLKALSYNSAPQIPAVASQASEEEALKAQAKGYETVLKREPENQTALEGLATTRWQLKDFQGAIAPLTQLVKRYPERTDYAKQLSEAKQLAIGK